MQQLADFYEGDKERCGFVLATGEIIEVENKCSQADDGYEIDPADMIKYAESGLAAASWHTHPGKSSVLSVEDYHGFRNWPELKHHIVGNDGVTTYIVVGLDVLIDE